MVRPAHALNGSEHGLDYSPVRQNPDVREKRLVHPVHRHIHAAGQQLFSPNPAPALEHVVLAQVLRGQKLLLFAQCAQLLLVVTDSGMSPNGLVLMWVRISSQLKVLRKPARQLVTYKRWCSHT